MVKLEQNIDGFEGKAIGIKQTILDAVDTLYEKLEKGNQLYIGTI
ncbi:MAG: hypothetical protein ACLTUL_00630 [Blautia faecis]